MKNLITPSSALFALMLFSTSALADQSVDYTYNTNGQILKEDGARTDVSDITTYTYDTSGNRATATNALNQLVRYNSYDATGRLLSVTDANNVTTEFNYHTRGWMLSSRVKHPTTSSLDSVTSYTYDAVGQLISMTLPNGSQLGYEYDDARRLKAIKNVAGERIEYQLDSAGNRTQEVIKDSAGTIKFSVTRAFDELSRVMKLSGNHLQQQIYKYDENDNTTKTTDGRNNNTQQSYDALNRVAKVIDPKLGETDLTYDAQDRIKTVKDARGNITSYAYDGFGNLLSQTSPDTGITTFTYDAAGNRTSATDARGVVVDYTYDALNRLLTVRYPAASLENVNYTYDDVSNGSYGVGRVTGIVSTGAGLTYRYNHLGLISQKIVLLNGVTTVTQYTYDLAGNLSSVTYPSGRLVSYFRNSAGQVQSITTKSTPTASVQTLVSNISYLPFGPASSYTYGNALSHSASYDNDYRLTGIQVGGILNRAYVYDPADNITGITNSLASSKSQTFAYDALDRLTNATGIYGALAYSYDPVGNRLSETRSGVINTYIYPATSNRLGSINQTTGGVASGTRSFTYDSAGNRIQGTAENGTVQNFTFNKANRMTTAKNVSTTVGTYSYNALGQRVSKTAGSVKELYHYDEAGQLIAVADHAGKTLREYVYNGNQLLGFVAVQAAPIPTTTITMTTAQATLQNAVLAKTYTGYTNTVGYIQFNGEGQASWPVTIAATANHTIQISYALASGTRPMDLYVDGVKKTTVNFTSTNAWTSWTATSVTLNLTAGSHTLMLKTTGTSGPNLDRIRVTPVAGQTGTPVPTTYYVHTDHLGSPQVVTAQNQTVAWMADYQPFGKLQPGQTNSIELYSRFPGQSLDSETGLYYNYFRDYDPSIGRYIESDPIGLDGGINTYAYVGGNPIKFIDPMGLQTTSLIRNSLSYLFTGLYPNTKITPNPNLFHDPSDPFDVPNDQSSPHDEGSDSDSGKSCPDPKPPEEDCFTVQQDCYEDLGGYYVLGNLPAPEQERRLRQCVKERAPHCL